MQARHTRLTDRCRRIYLADQNLNFLWFWTAKICGFWVFTKVFNNFDPPLSGNQLCPTVSFCLLSKKNYIFHWFLLRKNALLKYLQNFLQRLPLFFKVHLFWENTKSAPRNFESKSLKCKGTRGHQYSEKIHGSSRKMRIIAYTLWKFCHRF